MNPNSISYPNPAFSRQNVESILQYGFDTQSKPNYLVKWKNCPIEASTWVPQTFLFPFGSDTSSSSLPSLQAPPIFPGPGTYTNPQFQPHHPSSQNFGFRPQPLLNGTIPQSGQIQSEPNDAFNLQISPTHVYSQPHINPFAPKSALLNSESTYHLAPQEVSISNLGGQSLPITTQPLKQPSHGSNGLNSSTLIWGSEIPAPLFTPQTPPITSSLSNLTLISPALSNRAKISDKGVAPKPIKSSKANIESLSASIDFDSTQIPSGLKHRIISEILVKGDPSFCDRIFNFLDSYVGKPRQVFIFNLELYLSKKTLSGKQFLLELLKDPERISFNFPEDVSRGFILGSVKYNYLNHGKLFIKTHNSTRSRPSTISEFRSKVFSRNGKTSYKVILKNGKSKEIALSEVHHSFKKLEDFEHSRFPTLEHENPYGQIRR